ncbi:MAG: helix-turn-helix transcriptional regulator [Nitrosarchaeum sp.]|nr:helix-turn-helix transcriptional regulator [Nitrosarchaeum sp.]
MAESSFVLVDLKDDQTKKLAQVISNDTCRRILDSLAGGTLTETEIARKTSIPLSTVHYNLNLLKQAKLVRADEFHYSEKGKEVLHYALENKFIVIAPRQDKSLMERFKGLFAVLGFSCAAYLGYFFSKWTAPVMSMSTIYTREAPAAKEAVALPAVAEVGALTRSLPAPDALILGASESQDAVGAAAAAAASGAQEVVDAVNGTAQELVNATAEHVCDEVLGGVVRETVQVVTSHPTPHWAWFFAGAAAVGLVWLVVRFVRRR